MIETGESGEMRDESYLLVTARFLQSVYQFLLSVLLIQFLPCVGANAETYGPYTAETYSICQPGSSPNHAVVLIHGGAWRGGDVSIRQVSYLCRRLATHGIVVVSINYRYTNTAPWPAQLLDAHMAIRWTRKRYGLPTCAIGTSAGAQMALLAGKSPASQAPTVDPKNEAGILPDVASVPDCVVSISAPMDLQRLVDGPKSPPLVVGGIRHLLQGSPLPWSEALARASPITPTGLAMMPPTFVMHGNADPLLPVGQAREFIKALRAARSRRPDIYPDIYVETPGRHVFVGLTRAEIDGYIGEIATFVEKSK
jgi:acetyl esterase/lipase